MHWNDLHLFLSDYIETFLHAYTCPIKRLFQQLDVTIDMLKDLNFLYIIYLIRFAYVKGVPNILACPSSHGVLDKEKWTSSSPMAGNIQADKLNTADLFNCNA